MWTRKYWSKKYWTEKYWTDGTSDEEVSDLDAEFVERIHRIAGSKMLLFELQYFREDDWHSFPIQPHFSKSNPVTLTRAYRQPSTLSFSIPDTHGLLFRLNKNSPYNYQSDNVTYDPILKPKRKIRLKSGVRIWRNLTGGRSATSSQAPVIRDLSLLTDGVLGDVAVSGSEFVIFQAHPTTIDPIDIDIDTGSVQTLMHYGIRFATKSGFDYTLPASVNWGWSSDGINWHYAHAARPVGGEDGDYDDDLGVGGVTVNVIRTDLDVRGRYVRFRITPASVNQFIAIDECVVYGDKLVGVIGGNYFTGYIGGSTTPKPDGNIDVTAIDVLKKLIDNNSKRITAQYGGGNGPIDAADIIHSLLTSNSVWTGSGNQYHAPFDASELAWNSGEDYADFKYPVWQGQNNNIYGYVSELLHSIGFDIQADGDGVLDLYEPPYRQVIPDRVLIADEDGNNDCWLLTPHDDDVDLRNKVIVRSGNPQSGATHTIKVQPNSIAEFGELVVGVDDPLAFDQITREKIAGYIIRDYAYRIGTLTGTIIPDQSTLIKRVIAFRASRRMNLYAKALASVSDIRAQSLWIIDEITETMYTGDWTAEVKCSQYMGTGPTSPLNLRATSRIGDDTIIDLEWDWPGDGDIRDYAIYMNSVSETGFASTPSFYVGGTSTTFAITGLTVGTKYYFYVTAIGQNGQESVPSSVVWATAGGAAGDESNWTITDLRADFVRVANPEDSNGFYEYEILINWTSPPEDATFDNGYGFKHGEFRFAIGAVPSNPLQPNSWLYQDEWHGPRVPPLMSWDRVTPGDMYWYMKFRTPTDLTGVTVYLRVFTWQTTNGQHGPAHASNITSVVIP